MRMRLQSLLLLGLLLLAGSELISSRKVSSGPLYDYVHRYDPSYTWSLHSQYENDGVTTYILNLTSQTWQTEDTVDHTVWSHWVDLSVPHEVRFPNHGFLNIASGSNDDGPPDAGHAPYIADMARSMGVVAAEIVNVPNQPLRFEGGRERTEDDLIAHTWNRYMDNTSNPEIIARFPMVKASVRAMDAVTEFVEQLNGNIIQEWMTSGESKRGWTCWLTPAVDERVIAIAPTVLSMINMEINLQHHYRSLGGWTFAFFDYYSQGLTERFNDPEFIELQLMEDPWSYLEYLDLPVFVIKGGSDEFFLPDDTKSFYQDLPGDNYLWIVEKYGHTIEKEIKWPNIESFFLSLLTDSQLPQFTWDIQEGADSSVITMTNNNPDYAPSEVTVWYADSVAPDRRDWRLYAGTIPKETGIEWFQVEATVVSDCVWEAVMEAQPSGYRAFQINAVYPGPEEGRNMVMTTETAVVPNDYPHEGCGAELCRGILL